MNTPSRVSNASVRCGTKTHLVFNDKALRAIGVRTIEPPLAMRSGFWEKAEALAMRARRALAPMRLIRAPERDAPEPNRIALEFL
jgi:hypothetical protein